MTSYPLPAKHFLFIFLLLLATPVLSETAQEKELFGYINSDRLRENLKPLMWDNSLYDAALQHSNDMATSHVIAHKGSDQSEPADRIAAAGVYASRTAENIAVDVNSISAHTSLMKSLYHRENILEPEFTHGAVAVVQRQKRLYITEVFVLKLSDYAPAEARKILFNEINELRKENHLKPFTLSDSLSGIAQSHIETQQKFDSMTPLLIMSILTKQMRSPVAVNVYTTGELRTLPKEFRDDLKSNRRRIGIGFRRIRGSLCKTGCYFVALIVG